MRSPAGTPATAALRALGIEYSVHSYEHDPKAESYGMEAATALGLDPAYVFKTLLADVDGELVVGIVPVTGKLNLRALAAAVGGKRAAMADPAAVQRSTGYVIGGVSPLGQKRRLRTVLDESARSCELVYVSGGKRGMDLGLSPDDLAACTAATYAAIAQV